MSITNKKIDALRRLLLGNLYQECKDNPMGVSRERLEAHLEKIKREGCVGDCSVEEFVKTCQLKTHYPTCVDGNYRSCVEDIGERSTGVDKFYYNQYKTSKMFENEPDTEEEEEEEGEVCNVCGLTGDDDIGLPVQEMSCGHHSHVNCLIKIAQQKGRDNAECPECRKEFPLTEVPVPVRTLEQRQADSQRRYEFNASQMGFGEDNDQEENTEEDRLSESITQHISELQIDEAIEEIRDFYTRGLRRSIISFYSQVWFSTLLIEIGIGQISFDDVKKLVDAIFESNTEIVFCIRVIKDLYNHYTRYDTSENSKEWIMYIIKAATKHYIRHTEDDNMFSNFLQVLMVNNSISFLEEVMRIVEREGINVFLRDAFNLALEDTDFDSVEDRTRELIINWFNSHNYQAPSFDNTAQVLTDSIVENIELRNFTEAITGIREFYEREFEDEGSEHIDQWVDALLEEIKIENLEMDDVVSLADVIFRRGHLVTLNRDVIKKIRNIMRLGESQKRQCIYIVMRVALILITEFPDDEDLGILIETIIKAKALTLLKVIMKVADENDGVEVLKTHILDIINVVTDSQPKNVINEWFRSHNFPLPRYEGESESDEDEDDERPLQISRLTPPHERVRGGWFNRIRR